VVLVDRAASFPRDKVCGDALIPDALALINELGLDGLIRPHARTLKGVRVYAPNRRALTITGACACVPRQRFDDLLREAAVAAGARFASGWQLERPLRAGGDAGPVAGATFASGRRRLSVRAAVTLLATGAAAEPLKRFGVCERIVASASAARVYVKVDKALPGAGDYLCISYDRSICPGYGWIFPGPDDIFNVGIGVFHDARPPADGNLRHLLERFLLHFPPAAEVMRHGRPLTSLKGAPLRTTLTGARLTAPGLLVIGEAAGTSYAFSGEGIGKAIASGVIASRSLLEASDPAEAARGYEATMRATFRSRFAAYKQAQDWLSSPMLANVLAWRASRSRFVRSQLDGIFQETVDPSSLFSLPGLLRALVS
jgi:flavin-dependent dehydrogenase